MRRQFTADGLPVVHAFNNQAFHQFNLRAIQGEQNGYLQTS